MRRTGYQRRRINGNSKQRANGINYFNEEVEKLENDVEGLQKFIEFTRKSLSKQKRLDDFDLGVQSGLSRYEKAERQKQIDGSLSM